MVSCTLAWLGTNFTSASPVTVISPGSEGAGAATTGAALSAATSRAGSMAPSSLQPSKRFPLFSQQQTLEEERGGGGDDQPRPERHPVLGVVLPAGLHCLFAEPRGQLFGLEPREVALGRV